MFTGCRVQCGEQGQMCSLSVVVEAEQCVHVVLKRVVYVGPWKIVWSDIVLTICVVWPHGRE